jgi:hypothetical protein
MNERSRDVDEPVQAILAKTGRPPLMKAIGLALVLAVLGVLLFPGSWALRSAEALDLELPAVTQLCFDLTIFTGAYYYLALFPLIFIDLPISLFLRMLPHRQQWLARAWHVYGLVAALLLIVGLMVGLQTAMHRVDWKEAVVIDAPENAVDLPR